MRNLIPIATLATCFVGMAAGGAAVGESIAATSQGAAPLRLVLLVNLPDGRQTETDLATLPAPACVRAMRAMWRANEDAPLVGFDEFGPIPAFDAACLPTAEMER